MHVFIVRPFGIKTVLKETNATPQEQVEIDFEKVQSDLINPALSALQLDGGTTGKIFEPGDIREDMFSLLLKADIVIADITIHNANVFYELGIRHALRDKKTILIKSPGISDTPFDILGYKYLSYDRKNPAASVKELIQTIKDTRETNRVDSPVFKMLPKLRAQDYEKFVAVPEGFAEEVKIAYDSANVGMLSLLAYEVDSFHWRIPALRLVGEALFLLKAFDAARLVWEKIKEALPDDTVTNGKLATIYQRLAERELTLNPSVAAELLSKSDMVIDDLLSDAPSLEKDLKAEYYSLKGRNYKTRWVNTWKNIPKDQRQAAALKSDLLEDACNFYEKGYQHNMNHFYAGINTFCLLTILVELIHKCPDVWQYKFSRAKDAARKAEDLEEKKQKLATAVQMTIEAEQENLKARGESNVWLDLTEADYAFLTQASEGRVTTAYSSALEGAKSFPREVAFRQLNMFAQLDIYSAVASSVIQKLSLHSLEKTVTHYILFTGHMIDKPGRTEPRFPPHCEPAAKKKIMEHVKKEVLDNSNKEFRGVAGGACGGDILFHEVCHELGINSELYLALPREQFIKNSVSFAGPDWVDRFNKLYNTLQRHTLCQDEFLPRWLHKKKDYSIWVRNNLWELNNALVGGGIHMTLIALWDGKGGDGPGGTEHMVKEAKEKGAKTVIISMQSLMAESVDA